MIVSVQDAIDYIDKTIPEEIMLRKLKAIEALIRDETNNNFQVSAMRLEAKTSDGIICGSSPYINTGDTIEINESVNEGIYTVLEVADGITRVDGKLYPAPRNLITRVDYPESVREGVLNLLKWEFTMREKAGIKSESLSRHSVTYFDMDAVNSLGGYPVSLMGFLEPYYKARF